MPSLPSLPSIFHGSGTSSTSSISSVSTEEDETVPKLKIQATMILLATVTVFTGITAEWLVDSIDGLTKSGNISREFVALILLPLVGNAAEHVTAVTVSVKNKLDLAITVAVGSSIQIALFVLPFLILLGWMIGQPLTLFFDIFETVVVFVSVLIIKYVLFLSVQTSH
ncbi:Vacuolar calcium ion transporter AltName: Full=Vacuolar Ca(2+)/H(+) exchanger [Rhizoctonia solani AG-1 IB]|uniref:Rhizoctonia solani AG1-IB WGS project CAOJ00000000 data, isolate 7/3/14, contig 22025 n=1 Tax=Thanatephorus cucumeris (strain AG1-IB / isolate 7/3/14) TaxID=1108050 RepID=M5CA43_THACB|nr:Vacuolar calcium ion transporter AltName: Full=Vacuolar Ca(2+)/H(+) exchanger [Rhizoctonia solani AG-1 IB]